MLHVELHDCVNCLHASIIRVVGSITLTSFIALEHVNYNVYFCVFIEKYVYTKFCMVVVSVSDMPIYVPIVMYGLRLFYKKCYNGYPIVVYSMKCRCTPIFIFIGCCVRELNSYLCSYCNVWPGAVYCCSPSARMHIEGYSSLLATFLGTHSCVSVGMSVTMLVKESFGLTPRKKYIQHWHRLFSLVSSWIFEKSFRSKVMA